MTYDTRQKDHKHFTVLENLCWQTEITDVGPETKGRNGTTHLNNASEQISNQSTLHKPRNFL